MYRILTEISPPLALYREGVITTLGYVCRRRDGEPDVEVVRRTLFAVAAAGDDLETGDECQQQVFYQIFHGKPIFYLFFSFRLAA